MTVVTRFPPSPTGKMHIGNARTGLFNYLFARHHGGKFLLRIEDTDRERSTDENVQIIYDSVRWLGLDWDNDGDEMSQFARRDHHAAIAKKLVDDGKAYYCYVTKEELAEMRATADAKGEHFEFQSPWRDADPATAPKDVPPVIRIKAPQTGETVINDKVQGAVTVQNEQLDDFILLRSDGTPTYMLSVVVDDHDMGVTHVIRGNDHLNNAFRQKVLYDACGWDVPIMVHCPMIVGDDGKKLSKRHGAVGVFEFRDQGILPEALRNYILRLGWGHGDDEIISDAQAIEWFDLDGINKAPARMDFAKLENLNGHYIRTSDNQTLLGLIKVKLKELISKQLNNNDIDLLLKAMNGLKERAKTLNDLAASAVFYVHDLPLPIDEKAQNALNQDHALLVLETAYAQVSGIDELTEDVGGKLFQTLMETLDLKMGKIGPVLRAATCGTMNAPDLKQVLAVLGKEKVMDRLMHHMQILVKK